MANTTYTDKNAKSSTISILTVDATSDVDLTTQEAEDAGIIVVSAVGAGGKSITLPSAIKGKILVVINKDAADAVTVLVDGKAGIAVAATKTAILAIYNDDVVRVSADV